MVELALPFTQRVPAHNGLSIGALPIQESEIESSARALVEAWSTKNRTYNYYSGSDALFEALRVIRGADRESATVSIITALLRVENTTGQRLAESLTFASRLLEIVESCRPAPGYEPIIPEMWRLAKPTEELRGLVASKACSATAQASGDILGLPWEDLRAFFSQTGGLSAAAVKQWDDAQRAYVKAVEQRERELH